MLIPLPNAKNSAFEDSNTAQPPRCTPQRARAGLAESAACCAETLAEALGGGGGRLYISPDGF